MLRDIRHAPIWAVRPGDLVVRRADRALAAMDIQMSYDGASRLCFLRWAVETGRFPDYPRILKDSEG